MIWRVIFCWLLATTFAHANLPRHSAFPNFPRVNQYQVGGISLPNAASIANSYDGLGRLTSTALVDHWGHVLDGYGYTLDTMGLRTNIIRQLGLSTNNIAIAYDPISQITNWSGTETNGTLRQNEQLSYAYDAAGNLLVRTNNALVQTFTVDSLNQLSNVTRTGTLTVSGSLPEPPGSVTVNGTNAQTNSDFTFAASGNTLISGANTFTIVADDHYGSNITTSVVSVNLPATVNIQYDANGNLISDGTRTFQYDAENQLTNVYATNAWRVGFVYDGLNRKRVEIDYTWSGTWVPTNGIQFIYDGDSVIQERTTNNAVTVTYTRGLDFSGSRQGAGGIGGLLARTDVNGSLFYHSDGSGNITALMDGNQRITARYEYDPYGRLLGMWGTNASINRYRFSSKEFISAAQLYAYGRRFYDANFSRWLNPDPIQEAGGINLYGFVGNSPINNIDPYGLQVPAPMNLVVGFGPGYGQSISDYNNQVQSAANTSLPMITGALAATATGGLADAGLVGTGLMSPGIASGFATGALAASAGDAASQATAMALGNQQNFDPGQMAAAGATGGLLGGAAAGVAKAMSKPCPPKMGKGIVHNDQVVAHAPIEAVASHEALARQSGTLLTPPLAGTPGQLIPGAEAFTYTAEGGNVFVTGSMNFNQNVSVNVVQVVTRYVNGN